MSTQEFNVHFTGKIVEGESVDAVKSRLVNRLRIPAEQVDRLFARDNPVIKASVTRETAENVKRAFERAGAICEIRPCDAREPVSGPSSGGARSIGSSAGPAHSSATGKAAGERTPGRDSQVTNPGLFKREFDQYVTATLIDRGLDRLRNGYFSNFFEENLQWLTRWGLYGLYVSALLGIFVSIVIPARFDIEWGPCVAVGCGWLVFCLIAHYLAYKFLPNLDAIIRNTPTKMASSAFLDCFAVFLLIAGVSSLLAGMFFALKLAHFGAFLTGLFVFIFCEYVVSLCLKPSLLNISIDEECNAAEELLGLGSFFFKTALKLVPVSFGSGILFGILHLCGIAFSDYDYMHELWADIWSVVWYSSAALSPIVGYVMFVTYYFVIDIILSILSLSRRTYGRTRTASR